VLLLNFGTMSFTKTFLVSPAGTPFPASREVSLLKSVQQLLFSSTAGQPAATAAGTPAAAAAAALQPGWIARLVDRAMKPSRNVAAAAEAQQVCSYASRECTAQFSRAQHAKPTVAALADTASNQPLSLYAVFRLGDT
jgi:hypothetical protein